MSNHIPYGISSFWVCRAAFLIVLIRVKYVWKSKDSFQEVVLCLHHGVWGLTRLRHQGLLCTEPSCQAWVLNMRQKPSILTSMKPSKHPQAPTSSFCETPSHCFHSEEASALVLARRFALATGKQWWGETASGHTRKAVAPDGAVEEPRVLHIKPVFIYNFFLTGGTRAGPPTKSGLFLLLGEPSHLRSCEPTPPSDQNKSF